MYFLLGVIILISFIIFGYIFIRNKIRKYFGSNLGEIISSANLEDEEIPKSLASLDSLYLEQIKKDFPDININELKRMSEQIIIDSFLALDLKDSSKIKSAKIKSFIDKKIEEDGNEKVSHDNFKIHNTVISRYIKNNGVATIYLSSSFEYIYCKGGEKKKVQDRAKLEFIYIVDATLVSNKMKVLGINCPNCGSPLTTLGDKKCSYCGSFVLDIVTRVWTCNDMILY